MLVRSLQKMQMRCPCSFLSAVYWWFKSMTEDEIISGSAVGRHLPWNKQERRFEHFLAESRVLQRITLLQRLQSQYRVPMHRLNIIFDVNATAKPEVK